MRIPSQPPPQDASADDQDLRDAQDAGGGDKLAFERLYRRHSPRINSVAQWMLGTQDADDVVQDVFIRCWDRIGSYRGEAPFGAWLYRLAVNVILRFRERRSRHETQQVSGEWFDVAAATDPRLKLLYSDIETAVANLPARARDVFILFDVVGYSHKEIADLLAIPSNTSRWQLHEARAALRRYLD